MLGFLKSKVDLVELNENQFIFRSSKKFKENAHTSVRVALPPGSGKLTSLDVYVHSIREDERGYVHVGQLVNGPITEEKVTGEALRSADRAEMAIRVVSPKLPGFRAMTVDVSATGLQVEMDGPLEVGAELPLTLEFDRFDLETLSCPVQVRWCRVSNQRGRYRGGFQFLPEDQDKTERLQAMGEFFNSANQVDLKELLARTGMVRNEDIPIPSEAMVEPSKPQKAVSLGARTPDMPRAEEEKKGPPPAPTAPTSSGAPPFTPPAAPPQPNSSAPPFVPPPPPTGAPPAPAGAPVAAQAIKRHLDIPVAATLAGYGWELEQETLIVVLRAGDGLDQSLAFPDCRTVRDYRCFEGQVVKVLRVCMGSELLEQTQQSWDVGTRKHYQFLNNANKVVLELVSGQCGPAA